MTQEELYARMMLDGRPGTPEPQAMPQVPAIRFALQPTTTAAAAPKAQAPAPKKAAPGRTLKPSEAARLGLNTALGGMSPVLGPIAPLLTAVALPKLDDLVLGTPGDDAPATEEPSSQQATRNAPPKPKRYNPEQKMLDDLLSNGGKWSLNQLGAIAGMREAPGAPVPMKDVVMGQALELADIDWQRNSAAALALGSKSARDEALQEAIDRRQALLLQLLGEGLGPIADE